MDKQLMILPFDHRASFYRDILGVLKPTAADNKRVIELKNMVYDAFNKIRNKHLEQAEAFGILVDEEYGTSILKDAIKNKVTFLLTTEKSGQDEYKFEYGNAFGQHIKKFNPTFVKALVRYNPENKEINSKQLKRLKQLSDWCVKNKCQFLVELLVPPTENDLKKVKTAKAFYNSDLRFNKTVKAIKEMRRVLKVDVWKLEGFNSAQWKSIVSAAGKRAKIIILGRGESEKQVLAWLKASALYEQIVGFAIGRTIFEQPLKDYVNKQISKEKAVQQIAANYAKYVDIWLKLKNK
jgi:5-dehydro-2-deoxygluconokinase